MANLVMSSNSISDVHCRGYGATDTMVGAVREFTAGKVFILTLTIISLATDRKAQSIFRLIPKQALSAK